MSTGSHRMPLRTQMSKRINPRKRTKILYVMAGLALRVSIAGSIGIGLSVGLGVPIQYSFYVVAAIGIVLQVSAY